MPKRDFEKDPIVVTLTMTVTIYKDMSDEDIADCLPVTEDNFQQDMFGIIDNGFGDGDVGLSEIKIEIKR